ncbi:MAG: TetR-like C-terminal domain-containing protein [Thermoanaerobaculia bacterium]
MPKDYDFIFIIRRRSVRQFSDELAQRANSSFNLLADVVEDLMREGRLVVTNPAELALTIWAHLHGLVSLYRAGRFERREAEFRRLYEASFQHLLAGIETQPPETVV